MKKKIAILLQIYGTVQGVGFRPYVYALAKKYGLKGSVSNTSFGAEIIIEGSFSRINKFIYTMKNKSVKPAKITQIKKKNIALSGYTDFKITRSSKKSNILSDFPADLALCNKCKKELLSDKDRRFHYPFINCTQCGPRYSIVKNLPYDRKNTTMKSFKMCAKCNLEYHNASTRRFHAQPNACSVCGPEVSLYIKNNVVLSNGQAMTKAAQMIDKGKVLALKSIGGYHLACSAYNKKAILKLRKIKSRDLKPFAVMAKNINSAKKIAYINFFEEKELLSHVSPIVLLNKKKDIPVIFNEFIAKNNKFLAIMMPYTPMHYVLFDLLKTDVLVMTSANKHDEPIIYTEKDIFKEFVSQIDGILTNNRKIINPVDDSIVLFPNKSDKKIIIRRSRGYVPKGIKTEIKENILAIGADIKNSFCLTRNNTAYLSAYCGDMFNLKNLRFLDNSVKNFTKFLDVMPSKITYDLHPGYNSAEYVKEKFKNKSVLLPVQHHFAHIASVIAENNIKGKILGFAYDGTGFGYDGKIWGSECLLFNGKNIKRLSHFEYFDLPGGDIASEQIWTIALSLLHKYGKINFTPEHIKKEKLYKNVLSLLKSGFKKAQTCSAGRFLDGLTSLIGLTNYSQYEGQAPVHLESILNDAIYQSYNFDLEFNDNRNSEVKLDKIIDGILKDLNNKKNLSLVSGKIHETLVRIINKQASAYSKIYKVNKIALSGGVFQNKYILSRCIYTLEQKGFKVYFNTKVPINDGGISLGQAFLAG